MGEEGEGNRFIDEQNSHEEVCQRITGIYRIFKLQISDDSRGIFLLRCNVTAVSAIMSRFAIEETTSHVKLARDRMQGHMCLLVSVIGN